MIAVAVGLSALTFPALAGAVTEVSYSPGGPRTERSLTVSGDDSQQHVRITYESSQASFLTTVEGSSGVRTTDADCEELDATHVACPIADYVSVTLGGGNDSFEDRSAEGREAFFLVSVRGGDGSDVIRGGPAYYYAAGDGGRDLVVGGVGDDLLSGGDGRDRIIGGDGEDGLTGDRGRDRIIGGPGEDEIEGDEGRDRLRGGRGKDLVSGGLGRDRLWGGPGDDELHSEDMARDHLPIRCGPGRDYAYIDREDRRRVRSCETYAVVNTLRAAAAALR